METSAHHDRISLSPLICMEGYLRQLQDLQDVRVAELILQRDSQDIRRADALLRLQHKERNLLLFHDLCQIRPGRIDPLAPCILSRVQLLVDDLDSQMGHADLIDVRKAHGKADVYFIFVLYDAVRLIACIAGRLLDLHENAVRQSWIRHGFLRVNIVNRSACRSSSGSRCGRLLRSDALLREACRGRSPHREPLHPGNGRRSPP